MILDLPRRALKKGGRLVKSSRFHNAAAMAELNREAARSAPTRWMPRFI